jgi:hypothetical protein
MKTINKPLTNMGGLIQIWAIPSDAWNSAFVTGKTVSFLNQDSIYQIYCSPDSLIHEEPADHSTHAGLVYNMHISGFVPGNKEENRETFFEMENRKFIVIFVDGSENYLLAGNYLYPLRFSASFSTGKNSADRAGHQISFTGRTVEKAKLIDDPF